MAAAGPHRSGDFFLLDQRPFAAASPEIHLKYIGFDGQGRRVRDLFHPRDLASLLDAQIRTPRTGSCRVYTAGGGADGAMSLAQLNRGCYARFGAHLPESDATEGPYDIPWMIMDNSLARRDFGRTPAISLDQVLDRMASQAG